MYSIVETSDSEDNDGSSSKKIIYKNLSFFVSPRWQSLVHFDTFNYVTISAKLRERRAEEVVKYRLFMDFFWYDHDTTILLVELALWSTTRIISAQLKR